MRQLTYRNGFIKLWRLGDLNFRKQGYYWETGHAPAKKGIWAFPYPYFETFFAQHKYLEAMPKKLFESDEEYADTEWIKTKGKNAVRMTEFWYSGYIYTRLFREGYYYDDWNYVNSEELYDLIKKFRGNKALEYDPETGERKEYKCSSDHLELFIKPREGTIKTGTSPR